MRHAGGARTSLSGAFARAASHLGAKERVGGWLEGCVSWWGVREGGVSSREWCHLPLAPLRFAPSALALQEAGAPLSRRFRLASPTLAGKAPMRYSTRGGSQPADVAADDALPDLPLDASERCASTCPLSGSRRCARGAPHEPCAFHGASLPMRLRPTCLPACSLLRYDLLR